MTAHRLHDPLVKLHKRVAGVAADAVVVARGRGKDVPDMLARTLLTAMEQAACVHGVGPEDFRAAVRAWLATPPQ